jgi:uncharacterized protein YxeA
MLKGAEKMKKALIVFLSIHLLMFASLYYVKNADAEYSEPVVVAEADSAKVLSVRFENLLNHLSGITTHSVEDYVKNEDGTYTVYTNVVLENDKNGKAISLFAADSENNSGYDLIYCDLIDAQNVSAI